MSYYNIGTASVANGETTITFSVSLGSQTSPVVSPGDLFMDLAQPLVPAQRLASVDYAAGTAELAVGWPGASMIDAPYEVRFTGIVERSTAQTRRYLEQLGQLSALGIQPDAFGLFADRAAYDDKPARFIFLSLNGDGALNTAWTLYAKLSAASGDWDAGQPMEGAKGDTGANVVWLAAAGAPAAGTGADGDMYLDTTTADVYGPKAAGAWGGAAANIKGLKGDIGDTGPANSLAIGAVTGGAAADATITGAPPNQTLNLVLPTGATGNDGWAPVLAIVADGARYVQQVIDWTGGEGAKPATGKYVGATGLVDLIGDGVDIRGPSGAGTGDVVGPAGAVDGNLAAFDLTTGKLIKDSGRAVGTAAGNIPVLDGSGKLATSILPALAITDTFVVANQAAMLALVAEKGDVAIRSDLNKCFILSTNSPSTLADWKELLTPTDLVQSVAGLTGTISAAALKTALAIGDAASLGVASQAEAEAGTAADKAMTPQRTAQAIAALATGGAFVLGFFPHDNEPPSANYAVIDLRNGRPVLAFDDTTAWSAIFTGLLPASYGGGGLTVNVHWMAAATSGTVGWTVEIERGDAGGTDFDADSFAAAQTITATTVPATSGQMVATTVSIAAGANMDGLAAGELFRLRLTRDVANDTAAGNAQVLLVEVKET